MEAAKGKIALFQSPPRPAAERSKCLMDVCAQKSEIIMFMENCITRLERSRALRQV